MTLIDIFQSEGIELKKKSGKMWCHCPFHSEKTASCVVHEDYYYCFGCGATGDSIHFVMAYKSLRYKEALQYLRIDNTSKDAMLKQAKRDTRKEFNTWCQSEAKHILGLLTTAHEVCRNATGIDWIEGCGAIEIVRNIALNEHKLDILTGDNDKYKFELYRESRELRLRG